MRMTVAWPLATSVHVSFLSPKSFGTVIVKTPHWRRGRKCVWLTLVRPARLDPVVRTNRDVERLLLIPVEIADEQAVRAVRVLIPALERARYALQTLSSGSR